MSGSGNEKKGFRRPTKKNSQLSILSNIGGIRKAKSFHKLHEKFPMMAKPDVGPAKQSTKMKQSILAMQTAEQQDPRKAEHKESALNVTSSDMTGGMRKGRKIRTAVEVKAVDPKEKEKQKEDKKKNEDERRLKKRDLLLGLVKVGQIVEDSQDPKNRFEIIEQLGIGGFGIVHLVKNLAKPDLPQYAMKLEPSSAGPKDIETLKFEANIMVTLEQLEPELKTHFVKCISRGQSPTFKFVVMDLLGPSIYDLKKTRVNSSGFTIGTALKICIQTCEAVRDFHSGGFLHRDIKVQNYAVGKTNESLIYMIDFGIAKRFMEVRHDKVVQIKYREKVHFFGTLKLCPRAAHDGIEQAPKDDLESWLYMGFDLCKGGVLPWSRGKTPEEIIKGKKELFAMKDKTVFEQVPNAFEALTLYIDNLDYNDVPDYKFIINVLKMDAKELTIDLEKDFDWVTDNGNRLKTNNVTVIKDKDDDMAEFNENEEEEVEEPDRNKVAQAFSENPDNNNNSGNMRRKQSAVKDTDMDGKSKMPKEQESADGNGQKVKK